MPKKKNKRAKPSSKTMKGPEPALKTTYVTETAIKKTDGAEKAKKTTDRAEKAKKTTDGTRSALKKPNGAAPASTKIRSTEPALTKDKDTEAASSKTKGRKPALKTSKGSEPAFRRTKGAVQASKKKRKATEPALKNGFKCDYCGRTFSYKKHFEDHTCTICSHCGLICRNTTQLKLHTQKHCSVLKANTDVVTQDNKEERILSGPQLCEICHLRFESLYHLKLHMKRHGGKRQFKCDDCSMSFTSLYRLNDHKIQLHIENREVFQCPFSNCEESYFWRHNLRRHMKKEHDNKGGPSDESDPVAESLTAEVMCIECLQVFDTQDALDAHCCFQCDLCKRDFKSAKGLSRHKSFYKGDCSRICEICNKKFKFQNQLKEHKKIHMGTAPSCVECNKTFTTVSGLNEHMRGVHKVNGEPFKCTICDKKFTSQKLLASHMRNHHKNGRQDDSEKDTEDEAESTTETWQCETCPRKFDTRLGLKFHTASKTCGNTICEICKRPYRTVTQLKRHKQRKHAYETLPHKCSECGLRFNCKSSLVYHMRKHTREKPFVCTHRNCNKKYAWPGGLRSHVELIHERNSSKNFNVGKCKYCSKRFFKTKYLLLSHENRCQKKDDWRCEHCQEIFQQKNLYVSHVRNFCLERNLSFKCYCKNNAEDYNPEDVHQILQHVIKCIPSDKRTVYKCYICSSMIEPQTISLHIQDELLHSRLVNQKECTHECSKCKVKYPSEELLDLHTQVVHPCLTNFLKNYREPLEEITFPVNNKELLIKNREENRKLDLDELKFNDKFPETKCYVCFLTFHSKFMKRRHVRFCKKKYGVVQPTPTKKPSTLPLSKYQLRKQRGKVIHTKLITTLAQKIFARLQFDLLKSCLKSWVEKVGSDAYWNEMAREIRVQPFLLKKWLTTFTKAEQEDENSTFSKNREQIMRYMPHAAEEVEPEISILIDWEKETSRNQVVTIDLTGTPENAGCDELTPEDITKAKSSGVFYRKCTTCDCVCTSLEEYYRHNHKTASRYFNRKHASRENANKPRALKGRRKEWLTEKEKEPGMYDDLTPWMFEGKVPKHPCGICGKPFHGRFMKHAHQRRCKKMLENPDIVEDMDVEDDGMDTEVEDNRMDAELEDNQLETKEDDNRMETEVEDNRMDAEVEDNRMDAEVEDNRMETEDKVPSAAPTGPRLVLVIHD